MQQVEHPTLYQKTKGDKVKQWTIRVWDHTDGTAMTQKEHGQVGGKMQLAEKAIKKGKNIGRSNETTPFQQACSEAESAFKKQLDKGYVEDPSGVSDLLLPMSCQTFQKSGHRMNYPAVAMAKLNGVRSFNEQNGNGVSFHSKMKKGFYNATLKHLSPTLEKILVRGVVLDGEAYVHGWTLQEISRAIKKYRPGVSEQLQFWMFCTVDTEYMSRTFNSRFNEMLRLHNALTLKEKEFIRIPPWKVVNNAAEVRAYHDECVNNGFEGICIYDLDGAYEAGHRSALCQKYKDFIDHEFEIIGGRPAEGTQEGCVIFRVRGQAIDKNGDKHPAVEFDCTPKGSLEKRRRWMKEIENIKGKPLTVRYHELSEDRVPTPNPIGLIIRDYE